LREDICAPHHIDFHIGLAESEFARLAEIRKPPRAANFGDITPIKRAAFFTPWSYPARSDADWFRIEVPSANGCGNARALAQLAAIIACEGRINGANILSPDTLRQLSARRFEGDDLVIPYSLDWRTGMLANAQSFYGPERETLGQSGSGGSAVFADSARKLSAAYVMNKQAPNIMGDPRSLRLFAALYQCLGN
jgi:CubicO group peptidase (beta-lactamase class C family)